MMNKNELLNILNEYAPYFLEEKEYRKEIINFLKNNDIVFGKGNKDGHITSSSWIVSKDRKKVLLTHHNKLDKWLQLGGHTESHERVQEGALREAVEESGLSSIAYISEKIFDIDVHTIPARGSEKEHIHYDIRFLFEADTEEKLHVSNESKDVKWVDLDKVNTYSQSKSLLRMVEKTYELIKEK
jgi:8-oxo-dGTP pyrophosphatase MutT (NUDIX family)